jgi:prepilin-type processing-associated H-X9-DG protein
VYLASNQVWQSNSADIAVRCPGDHRGKVNVLFLDGRVAAITPAALTNAMATTNNVAPVQPVTR